MGRDIEVKLHSQDNGRTEKLIYYPGISRKPSQGTMLITSRTDQNNSHFLFFNCFSCQEC